MLSDGMIGTAAGQALPEVADDGPTVAVVRFRTGPMLVRFDDDGTVTELGPVDVAFPVLHGPYGEDGTVQGYLETVGVACVGADVTASSLAIDKRAMKQAFKARGLPQVPYLPVRLQVDRILRTGRIGSCELARSQAEWATICHSQATTGVFMSRSSTTGADMASTTRIPKAQITGLYGAIVKRFSKKMFGAVPEAVEVAWHNKPVVKFSFGIGQKTRKWHACDATLKSYAHMVVASLVGCSWCLDFGYFVAHNEGLDEAKARRNVSSTR